jgi:hypothetical protein
MKMDMLLGTLFLKKNRMKMYVFFNQRSCNPRYDSIDNSWVIDTKADADELDYFSETMKREHNPVYYNVGSMFDVLKELGLLERCKCDHPENFIRALAFGEVDDDDDDSPVI